MTEKKIAVIIARGGSKRIPKKNIKSFLGKPIIEIVIKTIKSTKILVKSKYSYCKQLNQLKVKLRKTFY